MPRGVYRRHADGSDQAELLFGDTTSSRDLTYSPDGDWLLHSRRVGSGRDIYGWRAGTDTATALVATQSSEFSPTVSPDGRWLSYVSNESGQREVYVRPFPNTGDGMWQVSIDGGTEPMWAHSGRELFYRGNTNMMVTEILPGATFVAGERRPLFSSAGLTQPFFSGRSYAVAPDDQRFLMIREQSTETVLELIVVENFFEELKAKVGN